MMYYRTIRNDIARSKGITAAITLFVAAAALLVSLAVTLSVSLAGAVDALMTEGKTPHFMQMHAGAIDTERLAAFAASNPAVDEYQLVEFCNIDGARIVFPDRSLSASVQDNGVSVQNQRFDFLLDLEGNRISVANGEVYVPVAYFQDGAVSSGDEVRIAGKVFTVAGFLRDSLMNSPLSSSKRFLVSEGDYAGLKDSGTLEYLIEFRLHDMDSLGAFETAYAAAGLEANGPTLTYPLFVMLNGLSDGLMIAVILLVSALVVGVAFLCIRFALLAKIEDDYREIGVMKAIGLPLRDIKIIYLAQYGAIAAFGGILGYGLSFAVRPALLQNIRLAMGGGEGSALTAILGAVGVLLVSLAIVGYVYRVLGRFGKISPAGAVRFGVSQEPTRRRRRLRTRLNLSTNRVLGTQVFLGVAYASRP